MWDVLSLTNAIAYERQGVFGKKIIVIRTSSCLVCPTLSYYFEEDLNAVAGSPCITNFFLEKKLL